MSLSKQHKAYKANGGRLNFADYAAACDRAAVARAARGSKRVVKKAVKAAVVASVTPSFERVEKRVDCFGLSKNGQKFIIGADASDGKHVARICNGKVVSTYTSKRGERARIECASAPNIRKLAAAGFTPKGF